MNIVVSFSYNGEKEPIVEEFKKIARREGKDKSKLLVELIEEFVKQHSSGNSTYSLDNWKEDPSFQAIPAYLSDPEKWVQCYKNSNEKDRTKLRIQAITLQKKFRMVDINQ